MSRTPRVIFAILFVGVIVSSHAARQTRRKLKAKTISLGIVAEAHQQEIEEHFRDFVHYVARKTSSASAVEGRVVIAPTLSELAKLLEQGEVDFYMDSPYPTYVVNFVHGAGKLLLRSWQRGKAEYRSLIFTKKKSRMNRQDNLRGKVII